MANTSDWSKRCELIAILARSSLPFEASWANCDGLASQTTQSAACIAQDFHPIQPVQPGQGQQMTSRQGMACSAIESPPLPGLRHSVNPLHALLSNHCLHPADMTPPGQSQLSFAVGPSSTVQIITGTNIGHWSTEAHQRQTNLIYIITAVSLG